MWNSQFSEENSLWKCDNLCVPIEKLQSVPFLYSHPLAFYQYYLILLSLEETCSFVFSEDNEIKRARKLLIRLAALSGIYKNKIQWQKSMQKTNLAEIYLSSLSNDLSKEKLRSINMAFLLCTDLKLIPSTLVVKTLASTDSDLYTSLCGGICALLGPNQCLQPKRIEVMLNSLGKQDPKIFLQERLRAGQNIWGFVSKKDEAESFNIRKRTMCLIDIARQMNPKNEKLKQILTFIKILEEETSMSPNLDLGLSALCFCLNLTTNDVIQIFTISRIAAWTAHYIEKKSGKN